MPADEGKLLWRYSGAIDFGFGNDATRPAAVSPADRDVHDAQHGSSNETPAAPTSPSLPWCCGKRSPARQSHPTPSPRSSTPPPSPPYLTYSTSSSTRSNTSDAVGCWNARSCQRYFPASGEPPWSGTGAPEVTPPRPCLYLRLSKLSSLHSYAVMEDGR